MEYHVPRSKRHQDTWERLVKASQELFSELGFHGTTTKAIAERAGLTEMTLFRHFPTKRALYETTFYPALRSLTAPESLNGLKAVLTHPQLNTEQKLTAIVVNRIEYFYTNTNVLLLLLQELLLNSEFKERFKAFWSEQLLELYSRWLADSKADGSLRPLADSTILESLITLTVGHCLSQILFSQPDPSRARLEAEPIVQVLMHGIGPSENG
jgi:AcrR family transcriptional regulator